MVEVPGSWFEVCLFVRLVQEVWVEVGRIEGRFDRSDFQWRSKAC